MDISQHIAVRLERSEFHDFNSGAETSQGMSGFMADHAGHDEIVIPSSQYGVATAPDAGADEDQKKGKNKKSPNEKEKMPI